MNDPIIYGLLSAIITIQLYLALKQDALFRKVGQLDFTWERSNKRIDSRLDQQMPYLKQIESKVDNIFYRK